MTTALSRASTALAAVGLAAGMLVACTPETPAAKTPKPSKSVLFETDEEAFAAAEKTYREYNEASNARLRGDKNVDPDSYLIGAALDESIDSARRLGELGYKLVGDIPIIAVVPEEASINADRTELAMLICMDLSQSRVVTKDGEEAGITDRPDTIASRAEMTWVDDGFMISEEAEGDVSRCTEES